VATGATFAVVGAVPLLAYAIPGIGDQGVLLAAALLACVTLAAVGVARARFVGKTPARSAAEVLAIGSTAALAAYAVGALASSIT
jgi:VIT1/CCC1 family predicted Fe2+/Mn2+ transporter